MTKSGVSQTSHRVAVALEKDKKLSVIVERINQKAQFVKNVDLIQINPAYDL